jgi:hypothetical protein
MTNRCGCAVVASLAVVAMETWSARLDGGGWWPSSSLILDLIGGSAMSGRAAPSG